jgi:D-3-phosphoglycerate dehydrogenase
MKLPRVVVPDPIREDGIARLREHFDVTVFTDRDEAGRRAALREADAAVVRNLPISAETMDESPRLKVIAKHGAGVDNIDLAAATARGIVVANVPGGNADAVAEAAVALMLATLRRVPEVHGHVVSGRYSARWTLRYGQLSERTLGLVGIGNVGARVAKICARGFNMKVLAYDPALSGPEVEARGAEKVDDLNTLLGFADVVSLHVPLTPATFHVIGREALRAMKPTAILVNTARGPLVDEAALAEALKERRIYGAGLDVFETEPPAPDNPLLQLANVVLSPHTAGSTEAADRTLAVASADIIIAALAGRRPDNLLNPEAWERRRR